MLNAQLLQQAKPFVDGKQSKTFWFDIRNTDRSVGASLSGYIARLTATRGWLPTRLPPTSAVPRARASAYGTPVAWSCT
ncbi:Glutamate synthase [NADPH] large chain precursor [Raoultella terrigena]|uniref:Glutamate synthase [NADPH] large chain n=1 Tax=Raoultella terrigena TaxID=577 RepID=A0A4U9D159_RAOTE|nr:Glutamate synthase [NADPH] large chain precursor [Raoultella terrigena]